MWCALCTSPAVTSVCACAFPPGPLLPCVALALESKPRGATSRLAITSGALDAVLLLLGWVQGIRQRDGSRTTQFVDPLLEKSDSGASGSSSSSSSTPKGDKGTGFSSSQRLVADSEGELREARQAMQRDMSENALAVLSPSVLSLLLVWGLPR